MKNDPPTENVAAPAADPGPVFPVLNRNPLVALALALINPLLGLLRRRETPAAVEKTKLETYRSTPVAAVPSGRNKDQTRITQGSNKDAPERRSVPVRSHLRSAPLGRTAALKGGCRHG